MEEELKKIIFLNIGLMENYKGLKNDSIVGGGSYVNKNKYGHEMFNFLPYENYMYGFVETGHYEGIRKSIRIENLGAKKKENFIDDVLVIWVSPNKSQKASFIVGWYNNATIYRNEKPAPKNSNRLYKGEECNYFIKTKKENATLLKIDERNFKIPRARPDGIGWMGQSNIWYANKKTDFKQKVSDFVNNYNIQKTMQYDQQKEERNRQLDPYKRQKIEKIAIEKTVEYYKKLGYMVDSVEKDNLGWDLEASINSKLLKIEVKGLSQEKISIELTPNEYEKMKGEKENYRISVVTNALDTPVLTIFLFSPENRKWEDDNGNELKIIESISARMRV